MLSVLLTLVFAAHLLAADVATAGPFVCLWLQWRAWRRNDVAAAALGRELAGASIYALCVTMLLGLAALGLVWQLRPTPFFSAAALVPVSRYWFGVVELLFYLGCMAAYVRLWPATGPITRGRHWTLAILALLAGTDVAYHFPPLFAVIGTWSRRPATWNHEPLRFVSAMFDPEVVAMTLHFLLASVAVTGVVLMLAAARKSWAGERTDDMRCWTTHGAWLALVPTVLQLLAGMLVLVQLPTAAREQLLGADVWATSLFGLAIVAALGLMHRLAAVALGGNERKEVIGSVVMMGLTVLLMAAANEAAR